MTLLEQSVGLEELVVASALDTLFEYRRPIGQIVLAGIPDGMVKGDAVPLYWPNYGTERPLYELRIASSVRDLTVDEVPSIEVPYAITDADKYLVSHRSTTIAGTDWHSVVMGHSGEVRFAHHIYKGAMSSGNLIGEGVRNRVMPLHLGAAIVGNMCANAAVIVEDNLMASPDLRYRMLALDMLARSIDPARAPRPVDQQG